MSKLSKTATDLKAMINHAIHDHEVTPSEYERILEFAHDDGVLDEVEKALLAEFQEMFSNGTIKKVGA